MKIKANINTINEDNKKIIAFNRMIALKNNKIAGCTTKGFVYIYSYNFNNNNKEISDNNIQENKFNNNNCYINTGLYINDYNNIWGGLINNYNTENYFNTYNHKNKSNDNNMLNQNKDIKLFDRVKVTDYGDVKDIIEMDDGNIVSCGEDGSINIIKITDKNAFYINGGKVSDDSLNKLIKLLEGNFVFCSNDGYLYFYKYKSKETELELIKAISLGDIILTFCKCNKEEYAVGIFLKKEAYALRFYNKNFKMITSIKLDKLICGQKIEKINDSKLIFSQNEKIVIINLKNHSIQNIIKLDSVLNSINIFLHFKENILLGGDLFGNIYEWEINNKNILENNKGVHYNKNNFNRINDIIKLEENKFVSCEEAGNLIIWEY